MERCGWVGQGKKYPTPEACLEDVRVFWGRRWDVQNCDRRIDPEAYSVCLTSIEVTDCGNVLEALNTALNKCAESRVCAGPRPR